MERAQFACLARSAMIWKRCQRKVSRLPMALTAMSQMIGWQSNISSVHLQQSDVLFIVPRKRSLAGHSDTISSEGWAMQLRRPESVYHSAISTSIESISEALGDFSRIVFGLAN